MTIVYALMQSFKRRPLAWLFLIASACLDAVGAATAPESNWVETLVMGQILVAGCWPALGRSHRLASAGIWLAVMLGFTAYSSLAAQAAVEWRYILGSILFTGVAAALLTFVWRTLLAMFTVEPPRGRFQFSVAELLGWMIVVAVTTVAFREAVGEHLLRASYLLPLLSLTALTSLWMAMFLGPTRLANLPAAAVAAAATGVAYMAGVFPWFGLINQTGTTVGVLVFVAIWIAVVRMDDARLARLAIGEGAESDNTAD